MSFRVAPDHDFVAAPVDILPGHPKGFGAEAHAAVSEEFDQIGSAMTPASTSHSDALDHASELVGFREFGRTLGDSRSGEDSGRVGDLVAAPADLFGDSDLQNPLENDDRVVEILAGDFLVQSGRPLPAFVLRDVFDFVRPEVGPREFDLPEALLEEVILGGLLHRDVRLDLRLVSLDRFAEHDCIHLRLSLLALFQEVDQAQFGR